jgi:hypothetical protein
MPRIIIAVGIAGHPLSAAGNSWCFLQWILGFRALGWDVWIVESLTLSKLVDAHWNPSPSGSSANEAHWQNTLDRFHLRPQATLLIDDQAANLAETRDFAATADLFLNISGHFRSTALTFPRARKIYLDLDPAFTQIWADTYGTDMNFGGHDIFFSVGSRLGKPGCRAPALGRTWHHTFPPVVLDHWPYQEQAQPSRLTTIAHWQGYKWCEWQGQWYTGKSEQFAALRDLPTLTPVPLEIATEAAINREELAPYAAAGWRLVESKSICADYPTYEKYIFNSSGEFSAAKGGYVKSRCGWFSDRSVCYLASGRPVIVEDTGLESDLPDQPGLHTFRTPEEAARACETVWNNLPSEQAAARRLAEEIFSSQVVISRLLGKI